MSKVSETIIGFAVYEDANEYLGIADVTLPEITNITEEIQGAGISGKIESVILGAIEAMTCTINFRTVTKKIVKLHEPRAHTLDFRVAQQTQEQKDGEIDVTAVKHVMVVQPKKLNPGKLANASTADVSGEYAVTYFATFIDGEKKIEIDQLNYIFYVNGTDWLESVRKALGK